MRRRNSAWMNFEDYGFTSAGAVERLGNTSLEVSIDLGPFPSLGRLVRLTPTERGRRVRVYFRELFETLQPLLPAGTAPEDDPYLGATNLLVRWRFERVLDVYCLSGLPDFSRGPVEVYSTLKTRRLSRKQA